MLSMEAHFASYEDFSSSLVLMPFVDDSCVGAKVCSHNPPLRNDANDVQLSAEKYDTLDNSSNEVIESSLPEISETREESNAADDDGTDRGEQDATITKKSETTYTPNDTDESTTIQIPTDYVLIKMKTGDNEIEELELREFSKLLTLLREAKYPLSLMFVPSSEIEIAAVNDSSREHCSDDDDDDDESQSNSSSISDTDVSNSCESGGDNDTKYATHSADEATKYAKQADEATKYAKQAASELRGRLSRWGLQAASVAATRAAAAAEVAATRASAAASVVQELREGRAKEEGTKKKADCNQFSTSEWLPKIESLISDEETLDSLSRNSTKLNCDEMNKSCNDYTDPTDTSRDDNMQIGEEKKSKAFDEENDGDNLEVEPSRMDTCRVKQLEMQLADVNSQLGVKSKALNALQQQLDAVREKLSKNDKTIVTLSEELQIITKAFTDCEEELEDNKKRIDNLIADNREKELEREKALKALNNEISVCKAVIEARDAKVETLTENISQLKQKLSEQSKELSAVESLRIDLTQSKTLSSTADKVIEKMKKDECEFQKELKEAKEIVDELNRKYSAAKTAASKSSTEVDKIKSDCRRLKMERNSLKTKADSLQKEMNQIAKTVKNNEVDSSAFDKLQQELQQLRLEHTSLQRDLEAERAEKRDLTAELNASRLAHQNPITNFLPNFDGDGSSRTEELERLISDLTAYSSAQALQIETLKQINAALTEDITKNGCGNK